MYQYSIDKSLLSDELSSTFFESSFDADTKDFVDRSEAEPSSYFRLILDSILLMVMPAYEVHGLLGLYPMHLISEDQWGKLLAEKRGGNLLDVGAGQGFITVKAQHIFKSISTTETSHSMVGRLRKQGFECFEKDLGSQSLPTDTSFDAISILNVLDRCDRPLSLLKNCLSILKPDGYVMIATPLPLYPRVRKTIHDAEPIERLPRPQSESFEECVEHFYQNLIKKNGLEIVRWTRAPYLWKEIGPTRILGLDDVVMACKKVG